MQRRVFLQRSAIALAMPSLATVPALASAVQAAAQTAAPRVASLQGVTVLDFQPYELERERGKVVLVFFWSTSCPVCRDKLPEFRVNYEGWRDKGFQLVAVNVDAKSDDLMRYSELTHQAVPKRQQFPMLWRGEPRHKDNFGAVPHVPTSFILDRAGRVVKEIHGRIEPALWDDIAELVLA